MDCLVRSSYPQLHGIVNLIQILQGGLEIVLLSWRTFPLTDLHSAEHLCRSHLAFFKQVLTQAPLKKSDDACFFFALQDKVTHMETTP